MHYKQCVLVTFKETLKIVHVSFILFVFTMCLPCHIFLCVLAFILYATFWTVLNYVDSHVECQAGPEDGGETASGRVEFSKSRTGTHPENLLLRPNQGSYLWLQ